MNLKQAKDALRPLGLSINKKEGEYRVAPLVTPRMPPKKAEDWAYYTNYLDDAVSTGRHMGGELAKFYAESVEPEYDPESFGTGPDRYPSNLGY